MDKNNQSNLMLQSTISAILAIETLASWVVAAILALPVVGWLHLPLTDTFGNLYALLTMILIRPPILGIISSVVTICSHTSAVVLMKSSKRKVQKVEDIMSILKKAGVPTQQIQVPEDDEELIG